MTSDQCHSGDRGVDYACQTNARSRTARRGPSDAEVTFYDALKVNDSAVKVLGDENLRCIARELLKTIRENLSIDWTAKESVRAKLRVMVKRILRKYGYPPDKQEEATQPVLQQAELLCAEGGGIGDVGPPGHLTAIAGRSDED